MWPSEERVREWEARQQKEFIPFCNYLMNSHQIGFSATKPGIFKRYSIDRKVYEPVCSDFAEVLDLLLNDATEVN